MARGQWRAEGSPSSLPKTKGGKTEIGMQTRGKEWPTADAKEIGKPIGDISFYFGSFWAGVGEGVAARGHDPPSSRIMPFYERSLLPLLTPGK